MSWKDYAPIIFSPIPCKTRLAFSNETPPTEWMVFNPCIRELFFLTFVGKFFTFEKLATEILPAFKSHCKHLQTSQSFSSPNFPFHPLSSSPFSDIDSRRIFYKISIGPPCNRSCPVGYLIVDTPCHEILLKFEDFFFIGFALCCRHGFISRMPPGRFELPSAGVLRVCTGFTRPLYHPLQRQIVLCTHPCDTRSRPTMIGRYTTGVKLLQIQ